MQLPAPPAVLALLLAASGAQACSYRPDPAGEPPYAELRRQSCGVLLRAVQMIPIKVGWPECAAMIGHRQPAPAASADPAAPPPPLSSQFDPAWCALIEPANARLDACLVEAIADTTQRKEVRCPHYSEHIAVGDLAFFALSARHRGLWQLVPPDPVRGSLGFGEWIGAEGRRAWLQDRVREWLAAARQTGTPDRRP